MKMDPVNFQALVERREVIRARWAELLFVEPVTSPLANPNAMIFMIDGTLDEVFAALQRDERLRRVKVPDCRCGQNPYLAYFRAGTQALHEVLVLTQARDPELAPAKRDAAFAKLDGVIRRLARREIEMFDSLYLQTSRVPALLAS